MRSDVYAELARRCGLEMPDTRHVDLDRHLAAFGARRFDREDGGRVPVHTLAGLLHVDFRLPSADYSTFLTGTTTPRISRTVWRAMGIGGYRRATT